MHHMTHLTNIKRSHLEAAVLVLFILPFFNGIYNNLLVKLPVFFWIMEIAQFVILPASAALFLFKKSGMKPSDIGLDISRDLNGRADGNAHRHSFNTFPFFDYEFI